MSKLRDQIIDEVVKSRVPASIAKHPDWPVITRVTGASAADAILALVRKAMLSSDAITAGMDAVEDDKDWPYWDKNDVVAHILTAGLDAAGITGEDGER